MPKNSAGLLMFRRRDGRLEVLIGHPGGPFWARKDEGVWSLPKGEVAAGEPELECAKREFTEETGLTPRGPFIPLGEVAYPSGKRLVAWAFEGDCEPSQLKSNTFALEWPPNSGQRVEFPEIDRWEFCPVNEARTRLHPAQTPLLDALVAACSPAS